MFLGRVDVLAWAGAPTDPAREPLPAIVAW
jgi:hypothetical protein